MVSAQYVVKFQLWKGCREVRIKSIKPLGKVVISVRLTIRGLTDSIKKDFSLEVILNGKIG